MPAWFLRLVQWGYSPAPDSEPAVYTAVRGGGSKGTVGFLLPTVYDRCCAEDHSCALKGFVDQIEAARTSNPGETILGVVVMQCAPDEVEEASDRLRKIVGGLEKATGIDAVVMTGKGKVASINHAIRHFVAAGCRAVGYIDDDVGLSDNCLGVMVRSFVSAGATAVVGASKVAFRKPYRASKVLHAAKAAMSTPATRYPHGCAILLPLSRFSAGIPSRYVCDDGYICFEMLQPDRIDPQAQLKVLEDCHCAHFVGGTSGEIYRRIRRSLLSLVVFLADYPRATRLYYLRAIHLYGLWPFAPFDTSRGAGSGLLKWLLKAVLALWTAQVAVELAVRGLLRRPLRRIQWAAYSWHSTPLSRGTSV